MSQLQGLHLHLQAHVLTAPRSPRCCHDLSLSPAAVPICLCVQYPFAYPPVLSVCLCPWLLPAQSCDHLPPALVLAVNGLIGDTGAGTQGRWGPCLQILYVGLPPHSTQELGEGQTLCIPVFPRPLSPRAAEVPLCRSCCMQGWGICHPGGEEGIKQPSEQAAQFPVPLLGRGWVVAQRQSSATYARCLCGSQPSPACR